MKTYEVPLTMTGAASETFTALLTFYQGPILNYIRLDSFEHEFNTAMLGHLEASIPLDIYTHVLNPVGVKKGDLVVVYKTNGVVVKTPARMLFDMNAAKLYIYKMTSPVETLEKETAASYKTFMDKEAAKKLALSSGKTPLKASSFVEKAPKRSAIIRETTDDPFAVDKKMSATVCRLCFPL